MGIVYRARQRSLDRIVAVKTLLLSAHASPESVKRLRAEASAAASLRHPNIVAIHEVGMHQDEHYLVMDYVAGPSLAKFIKGKPLPVRHAAGHLKTIAEAIHYAHERGILHRDLKPSNVLIGSNDEPLVTDFGLAKRFGSDSQLSTQDSQLTVTAKWSARPATCRRSRRRGRAEQSDEVVMSIHSGPCCTICSRTGRRLWARH